MQNKLEEKVLFELNQLKQLSRYNSFLLKKIKNKKPNRTELLAFSANLHSFYTGIENIFKRIAQEIDNKLPSNSAWHQKLLEQMAKSTSTRPPVISKELKEELAEYLAFRHIFRNLYSFELDWKKIKPLVLKLKSVLKKFNEEIDNFLKKFNPPANYTPRKGSMEKYHIF